MYSIQFIERGEQFRYVTKDLSLILERTYCNGHRIFTQSIVAETGKPALSFDQRAQVVRNVCEFFDTKNRPTTFVIWETDTHRKELEGLLMVLRETNDLISIEIDSEIKRQASEDKQNLEMLKAGWKITIEGCEIKSPDEYKKWMKDR